MSPEYPPVKDLGRAPVLTQRRSQPHLGQLVEETVGQEAKRVGQCRKGAQPVGGVTFRQDEIGSGRVGKRAEMSPVDGVRAVTGG